MNAPVGPIYNFSISETGGPKSLAKLPDAMTSALGAVRSNPNSTEEDQQFLMAVGQVLGYYLQGVDANCMMNIHVTRNVTPAGEESFSFVIRRQPFEMPVGAQNPAWTLAQGPLAIKEVAATTETAEPTETAKT